MLIVFNVANKIARVVDASALPNLVSANINACVLMMAEKTSDMILGKPPLAPTSVRSVLGRAAKHFGQPVQHLQVALRRELAFNDGCQWL